MPNPTRAYAFGLATVLFWSTVATAFKIALLHLDLYQLILYSCGTAVVILLIALWIRGELHKLLETAKRHWRISLISGALSPFIYYIVLFAAYDRLPAQVAQPINYTWAIVLTFLSIVVLKQRITSRDLLGAFVCYGGVVIIAGQGEWMVSTLQNVVGIALALFSTLIWATYWILNMKDEREPTIALCLNFLVALPLSLVACVLLSDPLDVTREGLAAAAYVGTFEMGLAFLFWSQALRLAENTSRVSNLVFLSPFLSLVFINQILGEPIYSTTYVGLFVIVAGLLIQQSGVSRPKFN